jgi:hypothetical protein
MTYVWAAIAAFLLALFFWLGGLHEKVTLEALQASNATALADEYKQREAAHTVKEKAYDKEIDGLKNDQLTYPTVAVRLCPSPASAPVPAAGSPGHELPAPAGLLPPNAIAVPSVEGPDYGPVLFALADRADSVSAKCRAHQ